MKKRKRPAGKKAAKSRRKPIMRHSREGARATSRRPKAAKKKTKKAAKTKRTKKTKKTKKAQSAQKTKKPARRLAPARARAAARPRKPANTTRRRPRGPAGLSLEPLRDERGMGAEAAGQSGDTEGLSRWEGADSESVEELVEEGQAFEAGIVEGVEDAPDADRGEVRTREVPEDDVPEEYLDDDRPGR